MHGDPVNQVPSELLKSAGMQGGEFPKYIWIKGRWVVSVLPTPKLLSEWQGQKVNRWRIKLVFSVTIPKSSGKMSKQYSF